MSKENKKKKEKKQKPIYIDDGSTVYDMSGLDAARRRGFSNGGQKAQTPPKASVPRGLKSRPKFKDCVRTYIDSVKLMFLPMLVVLGILAAVFMMLWIVMYFAG